MSEVRMTLDGAALTVGPNGVIAGEHHLVEVCNVQVSRTVYSPNRQHCAVSLLLRLGAVLLPDGAPHLHTQPPDFDPFVWY